VTEGPRCADWAREVGVDPIGTAGSVSHWLLVDWPLPWPRDAGEVEALRPLTGRGARLQLVVPSPDAAVPTVTSYRMRADADGWFAGYERTSRRVEHAALVEAATGLLRPPDGGDVDDDGPDAAERDVLVCGHGARDRCCGSRGTALALAALAEGVAVRRTSHTGGHRFAPTAVLLPEGTVWGFLDEDALRRIVTRTGPLDDLLPRYRGCAGLAGPAVQAAERVAFSETGWTWLDHRRRGVDLGDGRVRIEAVAPDGAELQWDVEVEAGRLLPVPECGRPVDDAPKSEAEVVVRSWSRSTAAG
jgi:hypothetical protein